MKTNPVSSIDNFSIRSTLVTENVVAFRTYTYDGAGNIIGDVRTDETYAYTYHKRNRLSFVTRNFVAQATDTYNAPEQLVNRSTSAAGGPTGTIHYIYDLEGHLIVDADAVIGATLRKYIWLPSNDNHVNPAGGNFGQVIDLASIA